MAKDNVELICSVAELAALFQRSSKLEDFLQSTVETVAYHMRAAVCSIYLYDQERRELILRATQGLKPDAVGALRMRLGEGITGTCLKELRPIRVGRASGHERFKFFPGINEEDYQAFLAVPIMRGLTRVGALVVQDSQPDYFGENDVRALQAIAAQLATTIESAQLFMGLREAVRDEGLIDDGDEMKPGVFRGYAVAEGVAYGRVALLENTAEDIARSIPVEMLGKTEADFHRALAATEHQIKELQEKMEEALADISSLIFSAQLLMLKDSEFCGAMEKHIREGAEPAHAIARVVDHYSRLFARSTNTSLREKIYDVQDIGHRLLFNLSPRDDDKSEYEGQIVVAAHLLPSDIVKLSAEGAAGLIMLGGSGTSHVSVLARSLQIPAIIAEPDILRAIEEDTAIQIDAYQGTIIVNPSDDVIGDFQKLAESRGQVDEAAAEVQDHTTSADGVEVQLHASVNLLTEADIASRLKAKGVGLYRSEFPFIVRNSFPSEEEQFRIYRALVDTMSGRPVVLRTLDIGGDKMLSYFPNVNEANPFLGLRAIRFSLQNKDIFVEQLNAMLRAGADADITIIFPLISSLDDFHQARDIVHECQRGLAARGIAHKSKPALGVMVELPAAVAVAEELAREADLLCIGTNDLVQYTLAVDRTNDQVSARYVFHHPAVLRSVKRVVDAALDAHTRLSVCGDMVRDKSMVAFLLGIGVRTLSVAPRDIPSIQTAVGEVDVARAADTARRMLAMGTVREIDELRQQQDET